MHQAVAGQHLSFTTVGIAHQGKIDYTMKKALLVLLAVGQVVANTAIAASTIGVGIGTLYNGFGLNVGKSSSSSLTFGAIGCISIWSDRSDSGNRSSTNFNCGVGVGHISTALLPGERHGLGITMALNYNTDEDSPARDGTPAGEGTVLSFSPSYHFFFKGVDRRGVNLGLGPRINFRDSDYVKTYWLLNLGYQF